MLIKWLFAPMQICMERLRHDGPGDGGAGARLAGAQLCRGRRRDVQVILVADLPRCQLVGPPQERHAITER